ncbi:MAG: PilC/PilY family type IV pilus protein [Thermodesulfobacteriota bacterium]
MDGVPCRGNYIILLTDGLESARCKGAKNADNTCKEVDYNAAVTEAANLLTINVKTFVVGFGQDIVGNQTLNNIANAGGTQNAYFAANLNDLKKALQAIFQTIANQFYGRSNPVITKARDRLFRGSFEIKNGDYYGHLMAWNADIQSGVLAPILAWDSGVVMDNPKKRGTVYTWTDSGLNPPRKVFQASDDTLYPLVNPSNKDINGDGAHDNKDAQTIINFTLDSNYNGGTYKGNRPLDWVLGDIYHSTPVVIGAPAFFFTDNNYQTFYNTYSTRETMIYVGANDGFLHAFSNTDGSEKFAIIPKSLLGKLTNLSVSHDFYVDGSPKAYDVYFKSESKWKTVLISGLRDGGPYYFAVDVTDPNDPKILWEWTDPNMGNAWGKPDIGKVKVGTDTKFVAFLTGGYSTTDNQGNSFYIVDIETGTTLKMWTQSNGMPVGSSTNKVPSGSTAYDSDSDGFVNYVYFGDTSGTLWKVDVSSTNIADWTLYDFWEDTKAKQLPIFYAPTVAKNDAGDILIFFGTGDELNLTDSNKFYSFYEITDQGATGKKTWTRNLDPGEKVLGSPSVANYVVYFTTWVYTGGGDSCGAGEGRLYGLKISKLGAPGASEGLVTLDPKTGKWTAPQSYISLGAGIPSAPIVTNGMIYISNSVNANIVIQIPIPGWAIARTKSWREVF